MKVRKSLIGVRSEETWRWQGEPEGERGRCARERSGFLFNVRAVGANGSQATRRPWNGSHVAPGEPVTSARVGGAIVT